METVSKQQLIGAIIIAFSIFLLWPGVFLLIGSQREVGYVELGSSKAGVSSAPSQIVGRIQVSENWAEVQRGDIKVRYPIHDVVVVKTGKERDTSLFTAGGLVLFLWLAVVAFGASKVWEGRGASAGTKAQ